jgi:hypothetical protein
MAARHQQCDEGKCGLVLISLGQERRQQVPFEVVYAEGRFAQAGSQRNGNTCADEQCAGQSRAARVRHQVDFGQRTPACASTWRVSGKTRRMWSREASSGTTPP